MIARILSLSVRMRWLVASLTLVVIAFGAWQITMLPIDAVPDVTNRQVQISTFAPTLGPVDIEKQVTFPVETALAGIPGLEMTRSFSRNGFSQVTAVFTDSTDVFFARQQVTERLAQLKKDAPAFQKKLGLDLDGDALTASGDGFGGGEGADDVAAGQLREVVVAPAAADELGISAEQVAGG